MRGHGERRRVATVTLFAFPQNLLIDNSGKLPGMIFFKQSPSDGRGLIPADTIQLYPQVIFYISRLFIHTHHLYYQPQSSRRFLTAGLDQRLATAPGLSVPDSLMAYPPFSPLLQSGSPGASHLPSATHLLTPAPSVFLHSPLGPQARPLFFLLVFFLDPKFFPSRWQRLA